MDKEQNKQPIEQTEQISVPEVDTTADVASSAPGNGGDPDGGIAGMRPETAPVIKKDSRAKFNKFALLSIILTLAAWVVLSFEGKVALGISVFAFILGCVGLKSSTRTWRNTAITAIVASAVLMVVLSAFLIVIFVGLNAV